MNYGLRTRDNKGRIDVDSTKFMSRLVYSTVALYTASGSVNLPGISGITTAEFTIALSIDIGRYITHKIARSGTTITWTKPPAALPGSDTLILVFAYS